MLEKHVHFENEAFIVLDKPSGWLSVAGRENSAPCLLHHLSELRHRQFWPVHRLDQPVSGLILMAKDAKAHRVSNQWFEDRTIRKTYEALSEGESFPVSNSTFVWRHTLLRGKKRAYERPFGKLAETKATFNEVITVNEIQFGFWTLFPTTGRPHQLRFQLTQAGFPIWGDVLYGSKTAFDKSGISLRAVGLDLSAVKGERFGLPMELRVAGIVDSLTNAL